MNERFHVFCVMATNPPHVSNAWLLRELVQLQEKQPELVNPAIERMLAEDDRLRWALVIQAYLDRQINLGKAAEMLGLPEVALRKRFIGLGIPVRQGSPDLAAAQAEVDAVRSWFEDRDLET